MEKCFSEEEGECWPSVRRGGLPKTEMWKQRRLTFGFPEYVRPELMYARASTGVKCQMRRLRKVSSCFLDLYAIGPPLLAHWSTPAGPLLPTWYTNGGKPSPVSRILPKHSFFFLFLFFLAAPQHMEFPDQGPDPDLILNPLCQARDLTYVPVLQRRLWSWFATEGSPSSVLLSPLFNPTPRGWCEQHKSPTWRCIFWEGGKGNTEALVTSPSCLECVLCTHTWRCGLDRPLFSSTHGSWEQVGAFCLRPRVSEHLALHFNPVSIEMGNRCEWIWPPM